MVATPSFIYLQNLFLSFVFLFFIHLSLSLFRSHFYEFQAFFPDQSPVDLEPHRPFDSVWPGRRWTSRHWRAVLVVSDA
jgi:hypothetical protein